MICFRHFLLIRLTYRLTRCLPDMSHFFFLSLSAGQDGHIYFVRITQSSPAVGRAVRTSQKKTKDFAVLGAFLLVLLSDNDWRLIFLWRGTCAEPPECGSYCLEMCRWPPKSRFADLTQTDWWMVLFSSFSARPGGGHGEIDGLITWRTNNRPAQVHSPPLLLDNGRRFFH